MTTDTLHCGNPRPGQDPAPAAVFSKGRAAESTGLKPFTA